MKTNLTGLQKELREVGASIQEASQLEALALRLQSLKDYRGTHEVASRPKMWARLAPIGIVITLFVGIGLSMVVLSWSSLPGQVLYPVKKLTENAIVMINPEFRGTVMTRRSQEVKDLVSVHAGQDLVLSTLQDYQNDAKAYKSYNYGVLEECKNNLTAARLEASPSERQAIDATLETLKDI